MARECCSRTSGLWQSCGSAAVSGTGFEAAPTSQGVEVESALAFAMAGGHGTSRVIGPRPRETLSAAQSDAVALGASDSGAIVAGQEEPDCCPNCTASRFLIELGSIPFVANISCLYPTMYTERHTCQPDRAVLPLLSSEDSRPPRNRLELLDGSVGASDVYAHAADHRDCSLLIEDRKL